MIHKKIKLHFSDVEYYKKDFIITEQQRHLGMHSLINPPEIQHNGTTVH